MEMCINVYKEKKEEKIGTKLGHIQKLYSNYSKLYINKNECC